VRKKVSVAVRKKVSVAVRKKISVAVRKKVSVAVRKKVSVAVRKKVAARCPTESVGGAETVPCAHTGGVPDVYPQIKVQKCRHGS
jgi:hypothetical protein